MIIIDAQFVIDALCGECDQQTAEAFLEEKKDGIESVVEQYIDSVFYPWFNDYKADQEESLREAEAQHKLDVARGK